MPGTLHSGPVITTRAVTVGTPIDPPCDALNASADCTVSGKSPQGIIFTDMTLTKGWNPVGASLISFVSTGTIIAGYV